MYRMQSLEMENKQQLQVNVVMVNNNSIVNMVKAIYLNNYPGVC